MERRDRCGFQNQEKPVEKKTPASEREAACAQLQGGLRFSRSSNRLRVAKG